MWEIVPHEVPLGIVVESLDGDRSLRPTEFPALLSKALGGVVLGLKVLVGGAPGAGKSTLCAELASQIAENLDGLGYWLDAEQNRDLVRELFPRTGSSARNIRLVSRIRGNKCKVGWREALQAVPRDAAVVVVDSLQRWGRSYTEQTALLDEVATLTPTVLVVSHFNKAGQFAGPMGNEYDADATAIVRTTSVEVTKCRWSPCPRTVSRPAAIS
ncbi:AAA family ATPase [Polyangium fumosum]|uniref:AAA family ATPase n=1 Tax=Polyangium fumosum TaxID=889272 RepID=UPI00147813A2|nr:AAA family ATPase [Polyangium fumosum]